jgi:ligand-binding sensor domain-containing protein
MSNFNRTKTVIIPEVKRMPETALAREGRNGKPAILRVVPGVLIFTLLLFGGAEAADVSVVNRDSGLSSNDVRALAVDGTRVYAATGRNGIALFDSSRRTVTDISGNAPLAKKEIASLAVFQGKLYVGTSADLLVYDGRGWGRLEKAENVTFRNVMLAASPDGKELWAAAMTLAGGTTKFDGSKWTFMGGAGRGLFNDISSFAFGKEGTWMGSSTGTVYLHKGSDVQFFRDGLSGIVLAVAAAGDAVYAGTNRGLFRFTGSAWKPVAFPDEWGGVQVSSMAADGETLYLGTTAGLVRIKGGKPERLTATGGLPAGPVQAVAAGNGLVFAGTSGGLAVVRGW